MMDRDHLQGRLGCVTCYACEYDPRLSYYVYLPRSFGTPDEPERYPLLALIHGTERSAEGYRNNFKHFAEEQGAAIIAPLFPAGLPDPRQLDGYNMLRCEGIDFAEAFLHMLDEMARRFPVDPSRIRLHGFSAGGQFAHRFYYLHPERLDRVSIGAPGNITYPDAASPWPAGTGGFSVQFGHEPDLNAMRRVAVQIVIGGDDVKPPMSAANGPSRMEMNRRLFDEYRVLGLNARMDVVDGADHNGFKLLGPVMAFFV